MPARMLFSQLQAAEEHPARRLVMETTGQVLERLRSEQDVLQTDNARINPPVEELTLPYFDFRRMSARGPVKHWRSATPWQREHPLVLQ
ncbi:MAG: ABC transporter substrate-binding protein [Pseudomonadota bacterium]